MNIRQMIQENNKLQEAMTPSNLAYYTDMVVYIRTTRGQIARGEALLLDIAKQLLEAQAEGKTAEEVFGEDPEAYCRKLAQQLPERKSMSRLQYQLMIPWIALTWFFLIHALIGFVTLWIGGPLERARQIPISTLILLAAGASVLINLVMNGLTKSSAQTDPKTKPTVHVRGIAIYAVIAIVIIAIGFWLDQWLPVLSLHPGTSLLLFLIGLLGTRLLFRRT